MQQRVTKNSGVSDGASAVKLSKCEPALLNATHDDSGETKTADFYPENPQSSATKAERTSEACATRETSVRTRASFVSVGL